MALHPEKNFRRLTVPRWNVLQMRRRTKSATSLSPPPILRKNADGFFHTQDTMDYSTKKPYQFNAGGTGSDLLRTKVFSERHGFSVGFESTRCQFIPDDTDECPGKISECPFIKTKSDYFSSGGSTFSVRFPIGEPG